MTALALVPSEIIKKWQEIVDLLAAIIHVPSAVIVRVEPSNSEVFVASDCKPSEPGSLYCETVMKIRQPLLVPDARRDERWKSSPDIKRGMVSYLGVPISLPDGEIFGTICVYDNKSNEFSQIYLRLLLLWRDVLQDDLRTLASLHSKLEQYEAKIRRLVDANIIGIIIWDLEGRILEANDAFLRMGGYDREDLIFGRLNRTDLTPPEWRERDARTIAELKMNGAVQPFEKEYFRKDGSRVPVLIGLAAFEERDQGVAFVFDLTERKRAEAVGKQLAAIVDYSEDAIVSKDLNGTIESWNGGAERLFGYQASEIIGKSILIIIPADRHDEELGILECISRGEHIKSYETVRVRKDGSLLDISLTVSPLRDAAGRIIGASKIARDITQRKRAEEALRDTQMKLAHANRVATMGQLSASITHEVNQPIGAARNNARAALNFLDKDPPGLDEVREALGCIVGDADRAGDIVDRIRVLIKKAPPRKEFLDINAGIREVIELTRGESVKNAISMQADLADGLPLIEGDRVQLQQVILNLIVNAVEAMNGAGDGTRELFISSRKANPGGVLVGVRDTGPGLAPETLEQVFEAFYTTKPGGLGMGLSICRSIIEAHGGRLWASADLPRGASFQFTLPAIANTAS